MIIHNFAIGIRFLVTDAFTPQDAWNSLADVLGRALVSGKLLYGCYRQSAQGNVYVCIVSGLDFAGSVSIKNAVLSDAGIMEHLVFFQPLVERNRLLAYEADYLGTVNEDGTVMECQLEKAISFSEREALPKDPKRCIIVSDYPTLQEGEKALREMLCSMAVSREGTGKTVLIQPVPVPSTGEESAYCIAEAWEQETCTAVTEEGEAFTYTVGPGRRAVIYGEDFHKLHAQAGMLLKTDGMQVLIGTNQKSTAGAAARDGLRILEEAPADVLTLMGIARLEHVDRILLLTKDGNPSQRAEDLCRKARKKHIPVVVITGDARNTGIGG